MGGLAVAAAGIIEVEDDFAGETDCRFAHVLRLEAFRGLDHDLLGRGGDDFAGVHHRLDRIVHSERDLAVGTKREILALDDDLASDVDFAGLGNKSKVVYFPPPSSASPFARFASSSSASKKRS